MKQIIAAALLVLAGCAQNPQQKVQVAQQQADVRYRAQVHTELAAGYYSRGQHDVAIEELQEALRADAQYVPAYSVLGLVYMELRDDVLAQKSFEQALRLAPNDADANNNYGWFLCNRGRARESVPHFQTALRDTLYRTPEKSLVNAGICSRRAGDQAQAEDFFRRALKIAPGDAQAAYNLADMSFARGDYAQAKTILSTVPPSALGIEALWLGVRVEHRTGDRSAEGNYGLQLRRRFPDAKETEMLSSGRYE